MLLNTKISLFFGVAASLMTAGLFGVSSFAVNRLTARMAEENARMGAQLARVYLTDSMVHTREQSGAGADLLPYFGGVNGVRRAFLVRGPAVVEQFGPGTDRSYEPDAVDREVLASGEPCFGVETQDGETLFRATIPFVADRHSDPDCLECHHVKNRQVLGAISLGISLDRHRDWGMVAVATMVGTLALFALASIAFFRRQTQPIIETAREVKDTVGSATGGDFSGRIAERTRDEIGQIAKNLNCLMEFLSSRISQIGGTASSLLQFGMPANANLLEGTTEIVDSLVKVARFKQVIEEDDSKEEVYSRLSGVLTQEFFVNRFTFYEVDSEKNRLMPVIVDGEPSDQLRWCDPQVLVRADICRARRTGHLVDSRCQAKLCSAFCPECPAADDVHICIPVLQAGTVRTVLQLVPTTGEAPLTENLLPFIQAYLREAAPVIEAKRLTDRLRESSMRDAMTGLYNRRFLEQYVDTLVAGHERRKTRFSVLMLDLDYFKKVNDTYGHEIGDKVLTELSRVLRRSVRASDLVVRYGGEEFVIILQDTGEGDGDQVAEKIRAAVEELKVQVSGTALQKTISIGVADFPDDSESFWQAAKYADVALYQAKERGRNRVLHFTPEMWNEPDDY